MIHKTKAMPALAQGMLLFHLLLSACGATVSTTRKVNELFADWDKSTSPGAAVVIVKDGAVVYQHGYGSANLEHYIPITPQTVFDVASVAKQFTGLAIAMLVDEGKLSLEDDVRKHLPDVPDFGKPITLQHLLHHTSGLRDWPETLAISGLTFQDVITMDTILEMVRRQRELDFAPGDRHSYSNTGYNLLAAVVAKVSGRPFRAWMDANLFQPLGMKHTHVCDNPAEIVPDVAESYAPSGKDGFHRVISQLAAGGSSSLFLTAEDMGKWLANFETAHAGSARAIEMMFQPGKLNSGTAVDYGFGIGMGKSHNLKVLRHTGSWAGYRSVVAFYPEKRFAVSILSNAANMDPSSIASKIADLYLGFSPAPEQKKPNSKPVAVARYDSSRWNDLVGTYRLGAGWLLAITREGDQLLTQATRESKFKMTPLSETKFFVEAYGAEIEFARESSGAVNQLRYRGIQAPKLDLQEATPDKLAVYAGDYWSEELRTAYRLEIRDGQLATWHRAAGWVHLIPTGRDRFDSEAGSAIEFTRDATAQVIEMRVSGGRVQNLRFRRTALPATLPVSGSITDH